MARSFPTIYLNDPSLEISDSLPVSFDLGIEQFPLGDNYAAVELKPVNQTRLKMTWNWFDITIDQFWALHGYFTSLGADYINWTPEGYPLTDGQPTVLKWRPTPQDIAGAFQGFDNGRLSIKVSQVFDHS